MWTRDRLTRGGVHPANAGQRIVADHMLDFFKTSPFARCWFLDGLACS